MRFADCCRIVAPVGLLAAPRLLLAASFAAAQSNITSPNTLDRALHLLYVAAAVMGVLLLVVAALAFGVYRRNKVARLLPNGTDDSAR